MHTDKFTKILLAAIAIALWAIALNPWIHPIRVSAQDRPDVSDIERYVRQIANGTCTNPKICGS